MSSRRRQRSGSDLQGEDALTGSKRRSRHAGSRHRGRFADFTNDDTPVPSQKTQQLRIGDDHEVEKLYCLRFKDLQQWACKILGKAFVKLIEPKKQTHHPYTGGDRRAPPWWPRSPGEKYVRHREPDHLKKPGMVISMRVCQKTFTEYEQRECNFWFIYC